MNEKQKDNTAKLFYDFCKITFAVAIIGQIAQPEKFNPIVVISGVVVSFIFYIFAYILDRKK